VFKLNQNKPNQKPLMDFKLSCEFCLVISRN
jgi:hypothetical protein